MLLCLMGGGGYPGYPPSRPGRGDPGYPPPSRPGLGVLPQVPPYHPDLAGVLTTIQTWLGTPHHPDLARVPPPTMQTWPGYPPPCRPGQVTPPPPSRPGMGYLPPSRPGWVPPHPRPGMGYPPNLGWGTPLPASVNRLKILPSPIPRMRAVTS